MVSPKFATAEEYFAHVDQTTAATMRDVLQAVLSVSAELHTVMAWNVPQVKHAAGKYVFGMSAARNHISLAPWSSDVMAKFAERIAPYRPTKAMMRVPVDWKVDTALISDLVNARLREIDG